jgi:SAM-dependent methyltransferase
MRIEGAGGMSMRKSVYRAYVRLRRRLLGIPAPGSVNFGDLRRLTPVSRHFGVDRGTALDRYYIERFLQRHAGDVRGRVLEVGESTYTRRYGGNRVTHSDVLHVQEGNPQATIIGDLADAPQIADATFDCIVLTQTLNLIYDARAAVRTLHRILKPGGVLLLTVPGITQVPNGTVWAYTWYWAFTELSVRRMLGEVFGDECLTLEVGGNVLAATALLHGLAVEEFSSDELDALDRDYPLIIAARALRSA